MVIMLRFACTITGLTPYPDYRSIMASFSRDGDCDSLRPKKKLLGSATSLWKKSYPCIKEVRSQE